MRTNSRILIVATDAAAAADLERIAQAAGYDVTAAAVSEEQAVAQAAVQPPDVILLDVAFAAPAESLAAAVRLQTRADAPVIYLCAAQDAPRLAPAAAAVAPEECLRKPFSAADLRVAAAVALCKHASAQQLQAMTRRLEEESRARQELMARFQQCQHDLTERVKELHGLYDIFRLVDTPGMTLGEMLQGVVNLLPSAWQYPEITCARLVFEDQEFCTANYSDLPWKQTAMIVASGKPLGFVEVAYLTAQPDREEGPFLNEERRLINMIAQRLGRIIERQQTAAALRDRESRLAMLVENMPVSLWTTDRQLHITSNMGKVRDDVHYDPENLIGLTVETCFPLPHLIEAHQKALQGETRHYEFDYQGVHLHSTVKPLLESNGDILGVIGLSVDLTEHHQIEEKLRQQNIFLEHILEALSHPFYVIDANDYTIQLANSAAKFGELALTSTCYALTHNRHTPCDGTEHPCPLAVVKKTGQPAVCEHVHYDPQGNRRYDEIHGFPIFDERGQVAQVIEYALDITERKLAEDLLRKLSAAVEQSPSILVITNPQGDIEYVNPKFMQATGYRAEEVIGHNPRLLKSGVQPPEWYQALWAEITAGKEWHGEFCNKKKDGALYWEAASIASIKNARGEVTHFFKAAEDITRQKEANAAIESSARRLQTVMETVGEGITLSNEQGYFEIFNPKMVEITGYSQEEANNRNDFLWLLYPDWQAHQHAVEGITEIARMGGNRDLETTIRAKDGAFKTLLVSTSVIQDRDERWFLSVYHDITARKSVEDQLVEERNLLRTLIDHIPDHIYVKDLAGRFVLANEASLRSLSLTTLAELIGKTDLDLFPQELAEQYYAEEQAIIKSEQSQINQERQVIDRVTGKTRWFLITKVPFRDSQGKVIGMIGMNIDISARKQVEIEMQHAKEIAEAANRAKSEFIANMSHELRTPLNGILGYAQILKRDPQVTEKQRDGLDVIQRSGDHLLILLNDLLDLSKIEAGKLELEPAAFNLTSALQGLVEMTRLRAQEKNLTFVYDKAADIPFVVYGDEKRLRQILLNLLGNAVKFTHQGKISLSVAEFNEFDRAAVPQLNNSPTHKLRFEVTDTGIGIPPEQQERIFLPFEQVRDKGLYFGGPGLGLALSQRLARMMGSTLYVNSAVGQGSRFWFDITLAEVEHASAHIVNGHLQSGFPFENPDEPAILPPPEKLKLLSDLANIGDIMEIRTRIEEIGKSDYRFASFVVKIRRLAKDLKVSEIQQLLKHYLSHYE